MQASKPRPDKGAIHPTALIDPTAELGRNVRVGPFTQIGAGVRLGDDSVVEGWCELGRPGWGAPELVIGRGSLIRSHSVFYTGSRFGDNLKTGHHVTVLSDVRAGRNFQIGSYGDVQGPCEIGDYVSFQSQVFVAPQSKIGNFCWLFINVVLTNDPTPPSETTFGVTLEDYVVLGAGSLIMPGKNIGHGAVAAAGSVVTHDVAPGMLVMGNPAREKGPAKALRLRDESGRAAYPWTGHYRRKYPPEVTEKWPGALVVGP